MSYESPREQCLDKAAEVLRTITGARFWGGAYPTDPIVEVGEDRLYGDVAQVPYLGLLPAPGSLAESEQGHVSGSLDRFRWLLYGYVSDDAGVSRVLWLLRLIRDCQRTLRQSQAFAAFRPGTSVPFAFHLTFEEEDLLLHKEGPGAEFVVPIVALIPDDLTT